MDALTKKLRRELVRGTVARKIFCHISNEVLDAKSAVVVTITGKSGNASQTAVYVGTVYDKHLAPKVSMLRHKGFTVEIIDGRELWK